MRKLLALQLWRRMRAESGRTLVEVIMGVAIASIVGISLSNISVLGLRFSHTSRAEDERVYPVRNAYDVVVQDLRLAQNVLPDCDGALGVILLAPGNAEGWTVSYKVDGQKRLVRSIYTDLSCTSLKSSSVLAYRITDFALTYAGSGVFELLLQAQSENDEHTEFTLTQSVVGRVLGQ